MAEHTLTSLRVVVEVARAGSFTAAAETMGYTQSAVSRQVAAAESVVGAPLFDRRPRGVVLTAAGEVLLRHATRVVEALEAATQELAGLQDRLSGTVVVGGFPTASAVLLPRAFAAVRRRHPGLHVELVEGPSARLLLGLRRKRSEVAVVAQGEGLPELDTTGLLVRPLPFGPGPGIAVARDHPLAARPSVGPAELSEVSWIVGGGTAEAPEFGAWPGLTSPRVAHTARDWSTRLGLVAAGLGVALVPGISADSLPAAVRWVPVRDDGSLPRRQVWLATRTDSSEGAEAVAAELLRVASALSQS